MKGGWRAGRQHRGARGPDRGPGPSGPGGGGQAPRGAQRVRGGPEPQISFFEHPPCLAWHRARRMRLGRGPMQTKPGGPRVGPARAERGARGPQRARAQGGLGGGPGGPQGGRGPRRPRGGLAGPGGPRGPRGAQGGAQGGAGRARSRKNQKSSFFEHPPCVAWPEASLVPGHAAVRGPGPPGLGAWGSPPPKCRAMQNKGFIKKTSTGPGRTCSGTGPIVGATDLLAAGGGQATWVDLRRRSRRA